MTRRENTRILVADDSTPFVEFLTIGIDGTRGAELAGVARDGEEAIERAHALRPDVIAMDVTMPGLSGLDALRQIMDEMPTPVVIMTGDNNLLMREVAFEAMGAGAVDAVVKPATGRETREFVDRLCSFSGVAVAPTGAAPVARALRAPEARPLEVVGLLASSGGPVVLETLLRALPARFRASLLVAQHTAPGFDGQLVNWLNARCAAAVELVAAERALTPGTVFVAPSGRGLQVPRAGVVGVTSPERQTPGDALFSSMARVLGADAGGFVLTGSGEDGAAGLDALLEAGGLTAVQHPRNCVAGGMPRAALARNPAHWAANADALARFLARVVR